MVAKRYRITNTTVKPLKTDRNGRDIRPLRDRQGHTVSFPNPDAPSPDKALVLLYPRKHVTVGQITDGILGLFKKGYVGITELGDISDELKKLTFKPSKDGEAEAMPLPEPEMLRVESPELPTPAKEPEEEVMAKAIPMGETHGEDALVNPDGEPNFVARAPKGGFKKKKDKLLDNMD